MSKTANLLWTLWTHFGLHADEALAIYLAWVYGERLFPGISQARVEFIQPAECDPDADWESIGILPIGVLYGWCDEHARPDEDQPPWKVGHCAATLMADRLGIYGYDPTWARILEHVRQNDVDGICGSEWDFCLLGKNMREDSEKAMRFMHQAISAIHHHETYSLKTGTGFNAEQAAWFFDNIVAAWLRSDFVCKRRWSLKKITGYVLSDTKKLSAMKLAEKHGINEDMDPAIYRLLRFATQRPREANLFDLKGIPWLIWFQNQDQPELAIQWALEGIRNRFNAQLEFHGETRKEYEEKARSRWVPNPHYKNRGMKRGKRYGKKLKMVTVQSDNRQIGKYSRWWDDAALTIQQTAAGNVLIFTNMKYRLDISRAAEMIRAAEREATGDDEAGTRWHYVDGPTNDMLLNGTDDIKQPPTVQDLPPIQRMLAKGLAVKRRQRSEAPLRGQSE